MKLMYPFMLATALSFAAGTAIAACPDTSAATDMNKTGAIAKDGSMAPLEGAEPGANRVAKDGSTAPPEGAEPGANKVAKDGSTMPLATEQGGGNKDLATSEQDVEAQQEGDKTAAAAAEDKCQE